jgi:hypothetical protein
MRASTCAVCVKHARTLAGMGAELADRGAHAVVVVPGGAKEASAVAGKVGRGATVVASDPDAAHAGAGLERTLFLQHSGTFLVNAEGVVRYAKTATMPTGQLLGRRAAQRARHARRRPVGDARTAGARPARDTAPAVRLRQRAGGRVSARDAHQRTLLGRRSGCHLAAAGNACSSQRGAHQFHRPAPPWPRQQHRRMIVASMRMAAASPTPICFMSSVLSVAKTAKTATMTHAALVTTRRE